MGAANTLGVRVASVFAFPALAYCIAACSAATPDAPVLITQTAANATQQAVGGTFTLFKSPADPRSEDDNLAVGPDGNLWFANYKGATVVRFKPSGIWTTFIVPPLQGTTVEPSDVVTGPDGRLWFGNRNGSGVIGAMKTDGHATEYPVLKGKYAFNLGPTIGGRQIWFTGASGGSAPDVIGFIDAYTGAVQIFKIPGAGGEGDRQIVLGKDGNLWFCYGYSIGRVTPSGQITLFKTQPEMSTGSIISGPDGDLWFVGHGDDATVGRMNTFGQIQSEQRLSNVGSTEELVVGPDNHVWITAEYSIFHHAYLVRMDTPQTYKAYRIPKDANYAPDGIVVGTDGNLWFDQFGTGNPEQHGLGMGEFVLGK